MKTKQKNENMQNSRINKKNNTTKEATKIEDVINFIPSSRCYEIMPTKNQQKILNDYIAAYRKIWNVTLEYIRENPNEKISDKQLRDKFVIRKNMSEENINRLNWTFRTGKRIREYAIKDLITSFKGCFTRLKLKQIKRFHIVTKSKQDEKQTITISKESSYIKKNFLETCGMKIKFKHDIIDQKINCNMKLQRNNSKYFIYLTNYVKNENLKESKNRIVGIDPGLNIFHTYYSPNGEYGFVGSDLRPKLEKMYKK